MNDELTQQLEVYNSLKQVAREYALNVLVPVLSKAVLEYGREKHDERSLLDLCEKCFGNRPGATVKVAFHYNTTPAFRSYTEMKYRMTVGAQCQIAKINGSMYPVPEMISMMLEQCDFWETDVPVIIEMAVAYLNGLFDKSSN